MPTHTISIADALACTNLLGECTELGMDSRRWQKHLTEGAERVIGGVSTAFKLLRVGGAEPLLDAAMLSGDDAAMHRSFDDCARERGHKHLPAFGTLMPVAARAGELAFRYSELQGGLSSFHETFFYDRYFSSLRIGDAAASLHDRGAGQVLCLMMLRQKSDRAFSRRHEDVLAFLSAALTPLVGKRLEVQCDARPALSPRMQSVLAALLEGDSEKQVAARLGLQSSTVHGYVRDLYRRFGVRSRAELMARFVGLRSP